MKTKEKVKEYTASELTKYALKYLDLLGYEVWRQNQIPVRGRRFTGKLGQPDIIGFVRNAITSDKGAFIGCEVKTLRDTLSEDQKRFLTTLNACGGIGLICRQVGSEIVIEKWKE